MPAKLWAIQSGEDGVAQNIDMLMPCDVSPYSLWFAELATYGRSV